MGELYISKEHSKALSLDIDGVLVQRKPRIQIGALIGLLKHGNEIFEPLSGIPEMNRTVDETPIKKPFERASYYIHSRRGLTPDAASFINSEAATADIYGNTGRAAQNDWIRLTEERFRREKVLFPFKKIFFKPRGSSSVESKAAALDELSKKYKTVTHIDDDASTVFVLAQMFPQVQFVIVQDLTTGILFSRVEAKNYPNVRRVASLREV